MARLALRFGVATSIADALRRLEDDFAAKEALSENAAWASPVSLETKADTVRSFYKALTYVVIDPRYPGHQLSTHPETIVHFGPPAGIFLLSDSTGDFDFVGLPTATILLTPTMSRCIRAVDVHGRYPVIRQYP
ncbi:hypothetical protein CPLU01_15993 [Colletotrichum plurivorum]|uniref:Uncharacterized protein n=1 Tax=Colletotrichum plurivorum TaxID=2175906 RepID=A0A8H6J2L8_9PEZI|nr:hypothetical protein CPLU01_15993 [Colletotrichum plurivorum]